MQSVTKVEMSLEEMNEMVKKTLQDKGLIGYVPGIEVCVMSITRETGVVFSMEVSVKASERPIEPSGPTPRGNVLLCNQESSRSS